MNKYILNIYFDEKGQGVVEYGLIISLISLLVVASLILVGESLELLWNNNSAKIVENLSR